MTSSCERRFHWSTWSSDTIRHHVMIFTAPEIGKRDMMHKYLIYALPDRMSYVGYAYRHVNVVVIAVLRQMKSVTAHFCNPMIPWLQLSVRANLITDKLFCPIRLSPKFLVFDARYVFTDSGSKRYTYQLKCNCFNISL